MDLSTAWADKRICLEEELIIFRFKEAFSIFTADFLMSLEPKEWMDN